MCDILFLSIMIYLYEGIYTIYQMIGERDHIGTNATRADSMAICALWRMAFIMSKFAVIDTETTWGDAVMMPRCMMSKCKRSDLFAQARN